MRHPDRPTGLRCVRCERPACPDCLVDAAVGFQCVDCVREGNRGVRRATTAAGGEPVAKPVASYALIAVNVAMYVLTAVLAGNPLHNEQSTFFHQLSGFPPSMADGEWWRLLTSGFLHFGPVHLAGNMVSLLVLAMIETRLGRGPFLLIYFLSLLGGSAAAYAFQSPLSEGAGASGAIYGLLGALIVLVLREKWDFHALMNVVGLLAVNLAISISVVEISLAAHLGGLAAGAAVAFGLVVAPREKRRQWHAVTVVVVVVAIVGLLVVRTPQVVDAVPLCLPPTADGFSCYRYG
ncbi:rhomboid family intramembrane serine protease [Actinokineospora auranticolor]|uniref:Membrane associated rhomboid family serine protease n=1 Tax=Actinokineospora auranticolor TaxID=155976 RepID=A0A2S6GS84_9PSEU|nr:rhomboid family intramembrane serine protease [Actinokineospora auranticolor]PPK68115.1 membrane associated rhomboid family serine protease [Actinokineospora auranticolor]